MKGEQIFTFFMLEYGYVYEREIMRERERKASSKGCFVDAAIHFTPNLYGIWMLGKHASWDVFKVLGL